MTTKRKKKGCDDIMQIKLQVYSKQTHLVFAYTLVKTVEQVNARRRSENGTDAKWRSVRETAGVDLRRKPRAAHRATRKPN